MKHYAGYIRVSTAKQGEHGVSLQEQRDAISRYAERSGFVIGAWFEERETAAKRGRPVFNRMLKLLRQKKADGVVIHKIDRGARNLKDWADLGELIDQGIEVRFANEGLDLHSRSGRLSADIQAVVAADYIRNLREETRKGFYGRLKQGIYPLGAPVGYLDRGGGKPKEPNPVAAPLVRKAFELYATGRYNLYTLGDELFRLGLRNRRGGRITKTGLSVLLNNPFYIGIIKLRKTDETFTGAHQPLITTALFNRVQDILTGKWNTRVIRHDFLFRRLLLCGLCKYSLIGERQKGHTYYRCHTRECSTTAIREEVVDAEMKANLSPLQFDDREKAYFHEKIAHLSEHWKSERENQMTTLKLRRDQIKDRLSHLTDAFLDGHIEHAPFAERKAALLLEQRQMEEALTATVSDGALVSDQLQHFLELAGTALLTYETALSDEKRDLVRIVTSNRELVGKNLAVRLSLPFQLVADRCKMTSTTPKRN